MNTLYKDMGDNTHALAVFARSTTTDPLTVEPGQWYYMGGYVSTPGGISTQLTIPAGATIVELAARDEGLYYTINGTGAAAATSPGYVSDGSRELVGPLSNLTRLDIFMAAGGVAHVQFSREA